MRKAIWVAVAVMAVGSALVALSRNESGSRATRIASELKCIECEGLSVADANTPTANAIRIDIAKRIDGGETDGEIRRAYVDRYGEDILFRPESKGIGALLWILPVALLLFAGTAVVTAIRRSKRTLLAASTEDEQLVEVARS